MDFRYNRQIAECFTEECKETFLKTGPRHVYCTHCQKDRQKERSRKWNKEKSKSVAI